MSLWTKIRLGMAVLGLVVAVPFYFFITHRNASNIVMFENGLDAPGELIVDGDSKGTLNSKDHLAVELGTGSHKIKFMGKKGALDEGTVLVPKKGAFGYRALYNLGGKTGIAVVTKYYGKDAAFTDKVDAVPEGTRLVELPDTAVMKDVDEAFPPTIRVTKNAMSPSVTRLCHVTGKNVGCPGW